MPLINTSLPNLIQGVSQQPDAQRYAGQSELQENALCSVVDGLQKRPATQHIATIIEGELSGGSFVHFIKRDDTEKYVVVHSGDKLRVWNLDDGTAAYTSSVFSNTHYLYVDTSTHNPIDVIKMLTIGDQTFVLNTLKTVTKNSSATPAVTDEPMIFIKQGDFNKKYGLKFGTTEAVSTSGSQGTSTSPSAAAADAVQIIKDVRTQIATQINNGNISGLNVPPAANVKVNCLVIKNQSYTGTITPIDGLAGEGLGLVYKKVGDFTDLPTIAPHKYKVKIEGDAEEGSDDYYVEFLAEGVTGNYNDSTAQNINDGISAGTWSECVGEQDHTGIDSGTMPRLLTNTALNTFTLGGMTLDEKVAGDLDTNPNPSFVGNTINGMFQYKGRLGFLSNDAVSFTEAGFGSNDGTTQKYNFYRTTVTQLLDADPIDVTVTSNAVTKLRAAQPFQENLILFSDESQFVLKGGDLLTAKTISITPITTFDYKSSVEPLPLGSYLYFPFERGAFTGVREFTINAQADIYDANEITSHVPTYIPQGIKYMSGSDSEGLIAMSSGTDLYIYKYLFNGNQRQLSAWSKFTIEAEIVGLQFIESDLFILQSKAATGASKAHTSIIRMPLQSGLRDVHPVTGADLGYNIHLDNRRFYTLGSGTTSFVLPYTTTDTVQVYKPDGAVIATTSANSTGAHTTVTFASALTESTTFFVGTSYTMKYQFSEQFFKASAGNTQTPSDFTKMLLRNGVVFFTDTASFTIKVTPDKRGTYNNVYSSLTVGSSQVGTLDIASGSFRYPIMTQPLGTTIVIENDTALPSNFQSAEFESFITPRSNRYG